MALEPEKSTCTFVYHGPQQRIRKKVKKIEIDRRPIYISKAAYQEQIQEKSVIYDECPGCHDADCENPFMYDMYEPAEETECEINQNYLKSEYDRILMNKAYASKKQNFLSYKFDFIHIISQ